jgi:hypothetical protein
MRVNRLRKRKRAEVVEVVEVVARIPEAKTREEAVKTQAANRLPKTVALTQDPAFPNSLVGTC